VAARADSIAALDTPLPADAAALPCAALTPALALAPSPLAEPLPDPACNPLLCAVAPESEAA
jgi:hypothetical protein